MLGPRLLRKGLPGLRHHQQLIAKIRSKSNGERSNKEEISVEEEQPNDR